MSSSAVIGCSRCGVSPGNRKKSSKAMARVPRGPCTCTTASSAMSGIAISEGCMAKQCSLVPNTALPRCNPSRASHPLPGARLLQANATSRNCGQRTRCIRLPPIEAILRICADAPFHSAMDRNGKRSTTPGSAATSPIRTIAPIRRPPSGRCSRSVSGSRLMSTTLSGSIAPMRSMSTKVVPPARNTVFGRAVTAASAWSTVSARAKAMGFIGSHPSPRARSLSRP